MIKEEIDREWQDEVNAFMEEHNKKMENMTEEESDKYIEENKLNEKLDNLFKNFKEKHSTQ